MIIQSGGMPVWQHENGVRETGDRWEKAVTGYCIITDLLETTHFTFLHMKVLKAVHIG
jgi:hypothetical protein